MIQPARAAFLKYYVNMYYEMQIQIWRAGNQMEIFLTSFQMQMQPTSSVFLAPSLLELQNPSFTQTYRNRIYM